MKNSPVSFVGAELTIFAMLLSQSLCFFHLVHSYWWYFCAASCLFKGQKCVQCYSDFLGNHTDDMRGPFRFHNGTEAHDAASAGGINRANVNDSRPADGEQDRLLTSAQDRLVLAKLQGSMNSLHKRWEKGIFFQKQKQTVDMMSPLMFSDAMDNCQVESAGRIVNHSTP